MIWERFEELRERRWIYLILLFTLIASTALGASRSMSQEEAREFLELIREGIPERPTFIDIFLNNFRAALLMAIPFLGLPIAYFITYNTGSALAAIGVEAGTGGVLLLALTALTPFFWLEFLAYSAMALECLYLSIGLLKKRARRELGILKLVVALSAILLFLGAMVEHILIGILTG